MTSPSPGSAIGGPPTEETPPAYEELFPAAAAATSEEGPEEALRGGDAGGPRHGIEELSVSVPAEGESTADGDGEED